MNNRNNIKPFLNTAWLFLAYHTMMNPNWWLITICVVFFPFWKSVRDWYDVQMDWKKSGKAEEVEQHKIDIENEQRNPR